MPALIYASLKIRKRKSDRIFGYFRQTAKRLISHTRLVLLQSTNIGYVHHLKSAEIHTHASRTITHHHTHTAREGAHYVTKYKYAAQNHALRAHYLLMNQQRTNKFEKHVGRMHDQWSTRPPEVYGSIGIEGDG